MSLFRQLSRVSSKLNMEDRSFLVAMGTNGGSAWLENMIEVSPFSLWPSSDTELFQVR